MLDVWVGAKIRRLKLQASISEDAAARVRALDLHEYQDGKNSVRCFSSRELYELCWEFEVPMTNFFDDLPKPDQIVCVFSRRPR